MKSIILTVVALASITVGTANILVSDVAIGEPLSVSFNSMMIPNFDHPSIVSIKQSGLCLSEHNAARSDNGKGGLTTDSRLETAARNHNQAMTSQNCFSHQCPGEQSLGDRVTSAGYKWFGLGENIAAGYSSCSAAVAGWMNSDGHRANILGDYKNVGCAMATCNGCSYPNYWTCVFGNPQ